MILSVPVRLKVIGVLIVFWLVRTATTFVYTIHRERALDLILMRLSSRGEWV
jgi:succinate-acetate transporter protein